jgi:hypothetical protein
LALGRCTASINGLAPAFGPGLPFQETDNAKHKGQIQMRIDGQTGDKLNLDGLVNSLDLKWTGGQTSTNVPLDIGLEKYNVYTNSDLGIALFVDQQIEVKVF